MTKDDIPTTDDEAGKEGAMYEWKASLKSDGSRDCKFKSIKFFAD